MCWDLLVQLSTLMAMTDVRGTRKKNLYVYHTDLQQDFSVASFSYQIDCALFHASLSREFS